jgi:hypothetical protein
MKRGLFDAKVILDVLLDRQPYVAASAAACIVTRDPKGFRGSPVRSLTPEAVLPLLGKQ